MLCDVTLYPLTSAISFPNCFFIEEIVPLAKYVVQYVFLDIHYTITNFKFISNTICHNVIIKSFECLCHSSNLQNKKAQFHKACQE